ncbi:SDR family oxidoreductase [Trebonia kvetii]|uniref:SDR family oxidoreductase n=1 Tax=Trebonia kvetii TaxID=2480626 RepID=A0A6P2BKL6_9ACTN|nr:SDR family NAD(P)-dependent oxidoreductase [Trebonia kvetii]TVY98982.1 SDR family oxidoreductase [Trebonia kvetii]
MSSARRLPEARTAVVTGAASARGIGRATARRLTESGWSVAVLDLDGEAAAKVAAELSAQSGHQCLGLACDIADERSVNLAIDQVEEQLPQLAGLVNVAGISSPVPFLELTTAEWDRVFAINSRGVYLVTRRVVPALVALGVGRVVSVSSASAQRGGGTYSKVPYSAAKAAVLGLTRALAREVGEFGVTVNAVSPGPVDTDIMGGTLTEQRKADLVRDLVVDRVGTVEDVAAVIAFLCGQDAGYITGATYNVNGGLIID